MKIGPLESKPVTTPAAAERKGHAASTQSPVEPSAHVQLSPAAASLSGIGSDATFDSTKVDRIAHAIRSGNFKINAEAIADKLIINAEELLGRKLS